MAQHRIEDFVAATSKASSTTELFGLAGERMLQINLDGRVWTKMGSMVAYLGQVKFTREGLLEHGIGKLLKRAVSGEGTPLTKAEGKGRVFLADAGKKISIINLKDETLVVNGNDVLAFQEEVKWDITLMRKVAGMMSGGLFNLRLSGTGLIAITTHYDPMTLRVTPQSPITTDPNATVAWSGSLTPELKTDISLKTFFGRGSGESVQMHFQGDGFVVVQPMEEVNFQRE